MKIRSVGVLSVGKIFGAIYALLGLLIGLVFAAIAAMGGAIANKQGLPAGLPPAFFGVAAIFFVPIIYGIAGFIGGLIMAGLYNLAAGFVGGIEIDFERDR
jgi:hypothetical protein